MNFNDVKLLLPASGYMKTSVVDGRTVIDEMRDASYERNHQSFAGDDRPELHKTLDGFHQVCVEKEVSNLISAGQAQQANASSSDWEFAFGTELNFDTVFGKSVARHQRSSSSIGAALVRTVFLPISGDTLHRPISYSVALRRNSGVSSVIIAIRESGGATGAEFTVQETVTLTDEFQIFEISGNLNQSDRTGVAFWINLADASDVTDIIAGLHMPIESAYPTLFTEGTRLAPATKTENLTGAGNDPFAISFFTDFIYQPEQILGSMTGIHLLNSWSKNFIGLLESNRHYVRLNETDLFANSIPGFPLVNYERYTYFYHLQYNGVTAEAYIGDTNGNLRKFLSVDTEVGLVSGDWSPGNINGSNTTSSRYLIISNQNNPLSDDEVQEKYLHYGKVLGFFNEVTFTDAT